MSILSLSLAQLIELEAGTSLAEALRFRSAQNHLDRERSIKRLIDFSCNEFEKNKHLKKQKDKSEDELTIEIVSQLHMLGIDASHDKQQGGHCDILVEGRDGFVWIAEAKKHSDYNWLEKGFKQLSQRYSSGVVGQDTGEILIYCWAKSSAEVLERWREELCLREPTVAVDESICMDSLTFNSTHEHHATKRDFRVRHKIVSLYFEPEV